VAELNNTDIPTEPPDRINAEKERPSLATNGEGELGKNSDSHTEIGIRGLSLDRYHSNDRISIIDLFAP
jgi:hypothetical protein